MKNVTLVEGDLAMFPDAVTERGRKHLDALARAVAGGARAAMLYVVQRADAARFAPAAHIDPAYAGALALARAAGVEAYAMRVRVSPKGLDPERVLALEWTGTG